METAKSHAGQGDQTDRPEGIIASQGQSLDTLRSTRRLDKVML